MSTEDRQSRDASGPVSTPTEAPTETVNASADELRPDRVEVEELIRGVLAAPARKVDPGIVALLRLAKRTHKNFQISLALRALRLEQGLRTAQQQIIRLQWELAQLKPREAPSFSSRAEDY